MNDDNRSTVLSALSALAEEGFEKNECMLKRTIRHELNLESGQIGLLRTTDDVSLEMSGIIEQRKGSVALNKIVQPAIETAAAEAMDVARVSDPDDAHDISSETSKGAFSRGPAREELDLMHLRLSEFREHVAAEYPSVLLRRGTLSFAREEVHYMNSSGVDLSSRTGNYTFSPIFAAKDGRKTSSFNYLSFSSKDLELPLADYGNVEELIRQSTEQVEPTVFEGQFVGHLIISPECLHHMLMAVCMYLEDRMMVRGTSIFRNSLERPVAASSLTLASRPLSDELASGYFITEDGFRAANTTVIEKGILKSFLLGLYGSRKTGMPRALTGGGCYVIEPGEAELEEMISSVDKGLLLNRFSGGRPSEAGDFSGVAKNSYYIEDGRIQFPVSEIMVSGNVQGLLNNVDAISRQRTNLGFCFLPWIRAHGFKVFGK